MDQWIEQYRAALSARLGASAGEIRIGEGDTERLLELAGLVAHQSGDRRNAPLSTFLAGCFAQSKRSQGAEVSDALREAADVAAELLQSSN